MSARVLQIVGVVVAVAIILVAAGTVYAQCAPPTGNNKCWTAGGDGTDWSDDDNWNPTGAPIYSSDVFHLLGDTILMDAGSHPAPANINAFSAGGNSDGTLEIQAGKGLAVANSFVGDTQNFYTLKEYGLLDASLSHGVQINVVP